MEYLVTILFTLSVLYAVLGNAIVYLILIRRKARMSTMWAGTPGYLYRVCVNEPTIVGPRLRRFAFSTNIAFFVAMIVGFVFISLGS
jgi:hypothetical protein